MKLEHINYPLVSKTHPPMYLMHKYWARKPHNVVAGYIKNYSNEGDIVLDPFCGSGVAPIEAIRLKRKSIGIDLNPAAIFITKETLEPINLKRFKEFFEKIKSEVYKEVNQLYETTCPRCKINTIATHFIWDKGKPIKIRYHCQCGRGKILQLRDVTEKDFEKIKETDKIKNPYWYPKDKIAQEGGATQSLAQGVTYYYQLFTHRNLIAFSTIFNAINNIDDDRIKNAMKFVFTSSLAQGSKLVFVIERRGRAAGETKESFDVGSWTINNYWIPPKHFEINAWNCFEERFRKILRGKEETNQELNYYREAKNFNDLKKDKTCLLSIQSALDLSNIPNNSVDYIFTDPPYGGSIPYSGLSGLWMSWLGETFDYSKEVTINDSQQKDFDYYHRMLYASFREMLRVLKPDKYLTVTFHSTDIKVWNSIILAVITAGFQLEKIVYQPPARPSAKGLLSPYGTAVGDYYIRFHKSGIKPKVGVSLDEETYEEIVVREAIKIIAERGEPTAFTHILNGIYPALDKAGYRFKGGQRTPENVIKVHLNKEFILTKDKKWWFKDPNSVRFLESVPLTERVEKTVINVLNKKVIADFDDILQEIFITFPNALTPDTQSIRSILEEYADKTREGKWQLKRGFKDRESQHILMIQYLAEIGKKCGFKVWSAHNKNKALKEISLKELNLPLKDEKVKRIREIDVLWLVNNEIKYAFEVENTTAILEAINRGANISYNVKRFIVLPEERRDFLRRRLKEPIIEENLEKYNWRFVFYNRLNNFYEENKKDKTILPKDFEKIAMKKSEAEKKTQQAKLFA